MTSDFPAQFHALDGDALIMQLNKSEALRQAQESIESGRMSSAIRLYQSILEADPSDLSVVSRLGEVYVKAGRAQEAVDHFLRIAENYLRTGSAISATHILKKVLKLDPSAARAHMNLGELYLAAGKTDEAHSAFIEAGAAFWHKGKTSAAKSMNQRALATKPDSRQAKAALALLEQETSQSEEPPSPTPAAGELPQILISVPDEPDATGFVPVYDYQLQPELPAGESPSNDEPLECMSEDGIVEQIALAELLVGDGDSAQALALLRATLLHKPDHIQIRAKLKDIYLRSEMIDRASEECLNIAAIFAARGENGRARDYILRARALGQSIDTVASVKKPNRAAEEGREEGLPWTPETAVPLRLM
ncbi:MAG TPA: tetratricopeptide repeat protein [Blastocatellia bacterium]|nr:tetratricopeptide repeat protein [Blastocatellia bacterium]